MGGSIVRGSRDAVLQDEDSHTGKTDEEEDWALIKEDGGGGNNYIENAPGASMTGVVDTFRRVFSRLRRRKVHWEKPRQEEVISSLPDPTTVVPEAISNIVSTIPEPTIVSSVVTDPPSVQISLTIPTPTPTPAPITTDSFAELTLDPRITTTIVSTISNFAPNGTGGDLSRAPITTGGTLIIFTTPTVRNRTTLSSTLVKTTTKRRMNTSALSTSTSTSTLTSSEVTVPTFNLDYGPEVTGDGYIPPSPTESEVSSEGNNSPSSSQPKVEPRLVGGIVGGIAGLALIAFALFLLLRRHKKQRAIQALDDAGYGGPLAGPSMVQRSISFLGGAFSKRSGDGASTDPSDAAPAERGFVKVAGRKLPPAIGGPRPEFGSMKSNAQSSYYTGDDSGIGASISKSSQGRSRYSTSTGQPSNPFASPPSSPTAPAPIARLRETAEHDVDNIEEIRPSPKPPIPRPIYNRQLSLGKDGVGRSHPSHDGSRGSRFTEDIT